MQIELSEILTCPDCRSPQGLIVLVDELDDEGRVRRGDLGCSRCQRRYPVRDGVVDLLEGGAEAAAETPAGGEAEGEAVDRADAAGEGHGGASPPPGQPPPPDELAVEVGALLDLRGLRGPVVLGHGLASAAGRLADLAGDALLLALAGDGGEAPGEGGFSLVRAPAGRLPLLPGKAEGVALWRPGVEALGDARRALKPGGRLAALRPADRVRRELEGSGLEVLASEERAAVARRPG